MAASLTLPGDIVDARAPASRHGQTSGDVAQRERRGVSAAYGFQLSRSLRAPRISALSVSGRGTSEMPRIIRKPTAIPLRLRLLNGMAHTGAFHLDLFDFGPGFEHLGEKRISRVIYYLITRRYLTRDDFGAGAGGVAWIRWRHLGLQRISHSAVQ